MKLSETEILFQCVLRRVAAGLGTRGFDDQISNILFVKKEKMKAL